MSKLKPDLGQIKIWSMVKCPVTSGKRRFLTTYYSQGSGSFALFSLKNVYSLSAIWAEMWCLFFYINSGTLLTRDFNINIIDYAADCPVLQTSCVNLSWAESLLCQIFKYLGMKQRLSATVWVIIGCVVHKESGTSPACFSWFLFSRLLKPSSYILLRFNLSCMHSWIGDGFDRRV